MIVVGAGTITGTVASPACPPLAGMISRVFVIIATIAQVTPVGPIRESLHGRAAFIVIVALE